MRHLNLGRDAVLDNPVFRPVKLISFARRESQRNKCMICSAPRYMPKLPLTAKPPDRVVAALIAKLLQGGEYLKIIQPIPGRFMLVIFKYFLKFFQMCAPNCGKFCVCRW